MSKYAKLSLVELEELVKKRGVHVERKTIKVGDFDMLTLDHDRSSKLVAALVERDNLESPIRANRISVIALVISGLSLLVAGVGVAIGIFLKQS